MLNLDKLDSAGLKTAPFPHLFATDLLPPDLRPALERDFPAIRNKGFFDVEELTYGKAFAELVEELSGRDFARRLGDKFGLPLADKPMLMTIRKWSAGDDGRVHCDGKDKIATALLYMNAEWPHEGGRFRFVSKPDLNDPDGEEIAPIYGHFAAFQRSDTSWHGHPPFTGERRVVQMAWLTSDEALQRKRKRNKFSRFLKSILHRAAA